MAPAFTCQVGSQVSCLLKPAPTRQVPLTHGLGLFRHRQQLGQGALPQRTRNRWLSDALFALTLNIISAPPRFLAVPTRFPLVTNGNGVTHGQHIRWPQLLGCP